jgi:hypothetical protein
MFHGAPSDLPGRGDTTLYSMSTMARRGIMDNPGEFPRADFLSPPPWPAKNQLFKPTSFRVRRFTPFIIEVSRNGISLPRSLGPFPFIFGGPADHYGRFQIEGSRGSRPSNGHLSDSGTAHQPFPILRPWLLSMAFGCPPGTVTQATKSGYIVIVHRAARGGKGRQRPAAV